MWTALLIALAGPAAAQPKPDPQVVAAVESAFPAHDLNGDGKLSRAEFAAWMTALRGRADGSPSRTRAWVTSAFTLADRDGNAAVTPAELTLFLSRG